MAENYMYYNPSSDCNTCISQYEYERLSEDEKKKYKRMDGSEINITREDIIKNYREVNTEQDYKIRVLEAENKRLKEQLNKEIHYNRIMKRALEKYAFEKTKMEIPKFIGYSLQPQNEVDLYSPFVNKPVYDGVEEIEVPYAIDTSLALQVLKEIDNKE